MEKTCHKSNTSANSGQSKINARKKAELKAAFDSATSAIEMSITMQKMKDSFLFDVSEINMGCRKMALKRMQEEDHERLFGIDSNRKKVKGKAAKHTKAFFLAKSADEKLKALQKMEPHFNDKELGYNCWILALKLYEQRQDEENMYRYGKKALTFLLERDQSSLMIPSTLNVLGYACCKKKWYDESLAYLNWSARNLSILESYHSCPGEQGDVYRCLLATHHELAILKTATGKETEIGTHVLKLVELREKTKAPRFSIDEIIETVVDGVKELGVFEQDKVRKAVKVLRKMKGSAGGRDSAKKNSKGD